MQENKKLFFCFCMHYHDVVPSTNVKGTKNLVKREEKEYISFLERENFMQ